MELQDTSYVEFWLWIMECEVLMNKTNIVLVGMPNSGKSTVGRLLAQKLSMEFLDTDKVIYDREGIALRDIVNNYGLQRFLEIQEECIAGINVEHHVIATGGSAVCSQRSMEWLAQRGVIIFLELDIASLEQRLTPERRFARKNGQSFKDIFDERQPLYSKYSHVTVNCIGKQAEETANEIENLTAELVNLQGIS